VTQHECKPAVLYAAKSTEDKRGSIPTQLADCRELAEREGWEVVDVFQDEAASAYSGNRGPGLAAARELAERLAPSVLVVQHSDRLARGDGRTADHLADLYSWAVKADVTIRTVEDDLFADPRMGRVMAALMGMRNTEDSRRKSEQVAAGMKRRAERGLFSGPRPFGYVYAKDGNGIKPERSEAAIVRRIFKEYADAGKSLSEIARRLHADRVPTQRQGSKWRQSTIGGILSNSVYVGKVTFRGELVDGVHKSIIKQELWDRAAKRLASRQSRGRGRLPKGNHLFRGGMLRCGECGEAMVPRTRPDWSYYYCNGHSKLGPDFCSMEKAIRRQDIDEAVLDYFERVALDVEATKRHVAEASDRKLAEVRGLRESAERRALAAEDRLNRVRRDYQDGKLEAEDWTEQRKQLEQELGSANAEADRLQGSEAEIERDADVLDAEGEAIRLLTEIQKSIAGEVKSADGIDALRAALGRLFEKFVVHMPDAQIKAHIRPDAIELVEDARGGVTRKLRREPLTKAEKKQRERSPSR
jgi:site-specific DNA recombinase